jgi:hypothetical protein
MKSQTHSYTDLDVPNMKKTLLQNKAKFKREIAFKDPNRKMVINVSWNKEKMFFNCSIAYLRTQKDGEWKNPIRFDDAHGYRHLDSEQKLKMPIGELLKLRCPILIAVINSMPKDKADMWKAKLFDGLLKGEEKRENWNMFLHLYDFLFIFDSSTFYCYDSSSDGRIDLIEFFCCHFCFLTHYEQIVHSFH